jgi:pteridine reductase
MDRPLEGKVALVTGGGQRLGRAIAEGLAQAGADVAVHYHGSEEGARQAVATIRAGGNRSEVFRADLTRPEASEPLVEAVERALGPVAILVNSAANFHRAPFLGTTPEQLEASWALNARAPFLLTQAVARRMVRRGGGDVVNVLDVGGARMAWRNYAAYGMSKAALAHLTEVLALELAPSIRVNGGAPGTVLPPEDMDAATLERLRARIPQGRFGSPADVVEAVRFLVAGPRFITGQILAVDGGRSVEGGFA